MKVMFISDIHGIKTNLNKIKEKYKEFNCEKLVVLGDLYYIGPRNDIKEEYDINYVREFLSSYKDDLICVRGNCDSEVDIEVSDFPIVNELSMISTENEDIYLTHGHIYNESNWTKTNSVLVYGHLHKPFIRKYETNLYINPGSISLPRGEYAASYLIYNENEFIIYDVNDHIIDRYIIK